MEIVAHALVRAVSRLISTPLPNTDHASPEVTVRKLKNRSPTRAARLRCCLFTGRSEPPAVRLRAQKPFLNAGAPACRVETLLVARTRVDKMSACATVRISHDERAPLLSRLNGPEARQ